MLKARGGKARSMIRHWFVVPPLDGPPSGGTLYNRELLRELSSRPQRFGVLELEAAESALRAGAGGYFWVDSLFLDRFESLWQKNDGRHRLALIAHYLPSLVEHGDGLSRAQLSRAEAFALSHVDAALAPSAFMKRTLLRLGLVRPERCFVVEPGGFARDRLERPVRADGVRAVMVANVTAGKGVATFLRALASELSPHDALKLTIVGRLDAESSYARDCQELVRTEPALEARVSFAGCCSPTQVVAELSASNLLVSASRMESFGMALAEGRTLGVPVVALGAGNTKALVDPAAGGTLVGDLRALARVCRDLSRDRPAHERAAALAFQHARAPRSFADAADDFMAQLSMAGLTAGT